MVVSVHHWNPKVFDWMGLWKFLSFSPHSGCPRVTRKNIVEKVVEDAMEEGEEPEEYKMSDGPLLADPAAGAGAGGVNQWCDHVHRYQLK